jgi:hypothetical protein
MDERLKFIARLATAYGLRSKALVRLLGNQPHSEPLNDSRALQNRQI